LKIRIEPSFFNISPLISMASCLVIFILTFLYRDSGTHLKFLCIEIR
jgi:hypothetical protein